MPTYLMVSFLGSQNGGNGPAFALYSVQTASATPGIVVPVGMALPLSVLVEFVVDMLGISVVAGMSVEAEEVAVEEDAVESADVEIDTAGDKEPAIY